MIPAMKNVLVPVENHVNLSTVLSTALVFARRFGAYVEGVPLGPDLPDLVSFDTPIGLTAADQTMWHDMADEERRAFAAFVSANGYEIGGASREGVAFGWSGETSMGDSAVAAYGRIFDITVLGRPGSERSQPRMTTTEAHLFESGRPILLAGATVPTVLGETVMIAWNQSMETARAVAFAMPILAEAKRVVVLTLQEHRFEGPSGEQLAQRLRRDGILAEPLTRQAAGRQQGEAILAEAAAIGADMLIKGAYTQSRLRQMIFGGATSHILWRSTMPVFMAN